MKRTGVSETTVKLTFPHWQEPDNVSGPFRVALGMARLSRTFGGPGIVAFTDVERAAQRPDPAAAVGQQALRRGASARANHSRHRRRSHDRPHRPERLREDHAPAPHDRAAWPGRGARALPG